MFVRNGLLYVLQTPCAQVEARNKTKCQTPPNGLPMFCTSFVMYFKSVRVSLKVSSTTGSNGYYKLRAYKNEARNEKSVWNTPNGFYTLPSSFRHAFRICLSQCYCLLHNGLLRVLQTPCVRNRGTIWNWVPNPWMHFMCALTQFKTHCESVRVDVKPCSKTGSHGYYKLHAYKNRARNEKWVQTPRMDIIRSLKHFGMRSEYVRVSVTVLSITGSNRY